MEFDLSQFEFITQDPYIRSTNRVFYKIREKKNHSKIFTLQIVDGVVDTNSMKNHIQCQGLTSGIIKIKGCKNMDSQDQFGIKVTRCGYLMEEIQMSLAQVAQNENINSELIKNFLSDIIDVLAKLQEEEIAIPFLTPEHIVRDNDGRFKLCDLSHALSVIGMDSSVQREIKSDIHYMDPDTFAASISGFVSTIQNYFKSVVYSLGLLVLEFFSQQFSSHRPTEEQITFMLERFAEMCPTFSNLVEQMTSKYRNTRPNCCEVKSQLQNLLNCYIDNKDIQLLQQQFNSTLNWTGRFTSSQPINQLLQPADSQIIANNQQYQDSLAYSDNQQTQLFLQSGIKLPENLRNQIKQWQEQRQKQGNSQNEITLQQEQCTDQDSADVIDEKFYDQLSFQQLYDIVQRLPLIKQIKQCDVVIDMYYFILFRNYNIDEKEKIFRCKYLNQDKIVKIYQNLPTSQLLQMLNNLSHISKLNIPGLCIYEGYYLEECQHDINQGTLFLIAQQVNSDLERALRAQQLQSKADKIKIIEQIANFLKQYNAHLIHGNLKPSNILLDNNLQIYIVDYGLSEVKNESNDQLFSSKPICFYASPEKTFENKLSNTSDVWSFGLILFEILTGQFANQSLIQKTGIKDLKRQGQLIIDKLEFFPNKEQNSKTIQLIKNMTSFQHQYRYSSTVVYDELQQILKYQEQMVFPQNYSNQYYMPTIQQSPSFQTIKKSAQTPHTKIHKHTGFSHKNPPPSARQGQRHDSTGSEFCIQGKTFNLQPQLTTKQKKTQ